MEINLLREMDHPNIVKLLEAYQDKKRYFIITEMCTGGELFDQIIKRPYYSERDAATVMKQVFQAIAYCHANKIVHRDLKPENLLLESEGESSQIKVIDFGTSQKFDPNQKMKKTYGTPYYIAPEVLKGSYTEKCDMWSCGVIMYILLSGRPPFDGENDTEILEQVSKSMPDYNGPLWSKVSQTGKDLVKKLLQKSSDKRISAKDAMGHPWLKQNTENIVIDEEIRCDALKELSNFRGKLKMQ